MTVPQKSYAACSTPTAEAGAIEWFSGTSEYKLCDGTNWDVIELDTTSLGACSPTANREWDATLKAYKVCDGSGNYKRINCLESGLVGHWKLDESSGTTATDSSPSGNDGTYVNSPTQTTGQFSNALDFSGNTGAAATNDRVSIGDPGDGSLDFGSGSFSFGLWVYATGSSGSFDMPWWKGGGSAGNPGYDMELGSGAWYSYISDGDETNVTQFSATPILNSWKHLMIVVDRGAGTHNAYVDAVLVDPDAISGTFGSVSNTNSANIGAASSGNNPFLGKIDDVRIYNRALSAAEVSAIYNGGRACASYGACSTEAQVNYDATNGMLWCDGTDFRSMKAP